MCVSLHDLFDTSKYHLLFLCGFFLKTTTRGMTARGRGRRLAALAGLLLLFLTVASAEEGTLAACQDAETLDVATRPCTRVRLDGAARAYAVECQTATGGYPETARGHWVQLVGTGAVTVLSTCGNTSVATALRLFADCRTAGTAPPVADSCVLERRGTAGCTDPRERGSELRFFAEAGERYYIFVARDDDLVGGVGDVQSDDDNRMNPTTMTTTTTTTTLCARIDTEATTHDTRSKAVVVDTLPYETFGSAQTSRRGADGCACCGGARARGVWYNFTGTGGLVAVDTCGYFVADTVLAVVGDDGACLAASDDACGVQSSVTLATAAGRTYSAFVRLARDTYDTFTLAVTPLAAPPHSTRDTALPVAELPFFHQGSLTGFAPEVTSCFESSSSSSSTINSGSSNIDKSESNSIINSDSSEEGGGTPGKWFALPALGDAVLVSTCGSDAGSATTLELYSADDGTCLATSAETCGTHAALLVAPRTPLPADGYLVRVTARTADTNFTLTVTPAPNTPNTRCEDAAPAAALPAHFEGSLARDVQEADRTGRWFALPAQTRTTAIYLSTCGARTTAAVALEVYDRCDATACVARADHDPARGCTTLNYTAPEDVRPLIFVTHSNSSNSSNSEHDYFELDVVVNEEASNAHCRGATVVDALPFFDTGETVTGALAHSPCTNTTRRGVWYTLTGAGEKVAVSTCIAPTEFPARVEVFRGGCSSGSSGDAPAECVQGQEDVAAGCSADAFVEFFAERGVQYHVLVSGAADGEQGVFGLRVASMGIPRASVCAAGTMLTGTHAAARGDTQNARVSRSTCTPEHDLRKGVWYTYRADRRARVVLDTCDAHTTFETHLEVYRACTRTPAGGDGCVATEAHRVCPHQDTVAFVAERGRTYHIFVTGRDTTPLLDTGVFRLVLNATELPTASSSSSSLLPSSSDHPNKGGRSPGQVAAIVVFGVLLPVALVVAAGVYLCRRLGCGGAGGGHGGLTLHRYRSVGASDAQPDSDGAEYQPVTI